MSELVQWTRSGLSKSKELNMESATPVIETHSTKESDEDQELQAYLNSLHTAANASLGKELAPSYPLKANAYISIASNTDSRECLPLVSNEKITQTGSEDSNMLPDISSIKNNFKFGVLKSLPDLEIHEGQANPDLELNIDEDLNTPLKVACSDTMSELSDMQEIYDEASDRSEPQRDISQAVTDAKLEAKKIALKKVLNEDEVLLDVNRPTSLIGAFTGDDNHNNPKAPDSNFSDERHRVDLSLPCPPWNITRTGASNLSLIVMDKFIIDHLQLLRDFVESSRMAEIPLDKSFKYTTLEDTKKFIKRSAASRFQK